MSAGLRRFASIWYYKRSIDLKYSYILLYTYLTNRTVSSPLSLTTQKKLFFDTYALDYTFTRLETVYLKKLLLEIILILFYFFLLSILVFAFYGYIVVT